MKNRLPVSRQYLVFTNERDRRSSFQAGLVVVVHLVGTLACLDSLVVQNLGVRTLELAERNRPWPGPGSDPMSVQLRKLIVRERRKASVHQSKFYCKYDYNIVSGCFEYSEC